MPISYNPQYRFTLQAGAAELSAHPVWNDDLSLNTEREQNEMFFRTKMSGQLVFIGTDADWILAKAFTTKFVVILERSNDLGTTWTEIWRGFFYMTDCEVSLDDKRVTVTPEVEDQYTAILAGMDNEYNLIELLPEIQPVRIKKHPMVQIYGAGESVISCICGNLAWEQEVSATDDYDLLREEYHFYVENQQTVARAELNGSLYEEYEGYVPDSPSGSWGNEVIEYTLNSASGTTYLWFKKEIVAGAQIAITTDIQILRTSDDAILYRGLYYDIDPANYSVELEHTSLTSGTIELSVMTNQLCARILCDVEDYDGTETTPISAEDLCGNNRQYKRVLPFALGTRYLMASSASSNTPTEYGKKNDNEYWAKPSAQVELFPVGRTQWALTSNWFKNDGNILGVIRNYGKKTYTLNTTYPLSSVLSVLLAKIGAGVIHQAESQYSEFLYDSTNPVSNEQGYTLLISPKSNLLAGEFSQPAAKAPITLKKVLEMLRNVYQCYWHIDGSDRLCIEHISYYKNGGSYDQSPSVGLDLTATFNRYGKPLAYDTSKYKFDKLKMPQRYEFGWMDGVTVPFKGQPIEIVSPYVEQGEVESVTVAEFSSDIDYMLLCPEDISVDGFALIGARLSGQNYVIPEVTLNNTAYPWLEYTVTVQNGLLAFCYLQSRYWISDMPARSIKVNTIATQALGIMRTKIQELNHPQYDEPNPLRLIKTYLGNGFIASQQIRLTSRMSKTTLNYDPE